MKRAAVVSLLVVLVMAGAPVGSSVAADGPGCVQGTATDAARRLVHEGAELRGLSQVAGFDSALVTAPVIHPGVRHRLVRAGNLWCDAQAGFNSAWDIARATRDAGAMASAFATLAAAPWFDGVEVTALRAIPGGIVTLTTHARTNGIVADWRIAVDRDGIRRAEWTATDIGVEPFTAETEGLTALPGASRAFVRSAAGLLEEVDPILATAGDPELDTLTAEAVMSDGFIVEIRNGDTPLGIALTEDTGNETVDFVRLARQVAKDNYEEFLSWGLEGGWTPADRGAIRIDDALSLYCIACVLVSQQFNIHMSSQVVPILARLGTRYPDHDLAVSLVVGHEMFHNFQNAYSGAQTLGSVRTSTAYSEGLARFQEILHPYAAISHQPESLVYTNNSNGCNGYLADGSNATSMATAPYHHSYDACYFWFAFYAAHGIDGVRALVEATTTHAPADDATEWVNIVEEASGRSYSEEMASFASFAIAGTGYIWGPVDGSSPALNWGKYLERWTPLTLTHGAVSHLVNPHAMMGVRIGKAGILTYTGDAPAPDLYRITGVGSFEPIASGDPVSAGSYVVAVHPRTPSITAVLELSSS